MKLLGTVYRIICLSKPLLPCYVGSTFDTVRKRWTRHKASYKTWLKGNTHFGCSVFKLFELYGIENFKIIPIKQYLVYAESRKDKRCLGVYEQLYISKLDTINERDVFTIEWLNKIKRQLWYKANKDRLKLYYEMYRKNNKDKLRLYHQNYYKTKIRVSNSEL